MSYQLSIIIPVYNDWDLLLLCLERLDRQNFPAELMEVIVVDNGSTSPPPTTVHKRPHTFLLQQPTPGSYGARNTGIAAARGELIAFTDADCLPAPDWVSQGIASLTAGQDVGLAAGRVNVLPRDRQNPTVVERYDMIRGFPVAEYVERWHFGITANIFTRREIIDEVGPFDPSLKSGGDSEWCQRVHAAGYRVVYAPEAVVDHPARHSVAQIWGKARRVAGGLHDMFRRTSPPVFYLRHSFWVDLFPPYTKSKALLGLKQVSLWERIQLVAIEWVYNYGRLYERVRLLFGGRTHRS
ncbi:MAG: glycosyltransferase [Ardenticatenaceae bacterium]|nr:glycosyltransferase [Ardenticatenaceae bacterium]